MKRLFTALLVCVYVTTLILSSFLPVLTAEGAESEGEIVGGEVGGEQEISQLEWVSYTDYLVKESEKDFADPARNVGYEAVFNLDAWDSFICTADPAASGAAWSYISGADLTDADGNSIRVKIVAHATDAAGNIWYQVEAVGRSALPVSLEEKSYIYHLDAYSYDKPSLLMMPLKGMFLGETVEIKKEAVEASRSEILPTAELPVFFNVVPTGDGWYDLGDTTGWHTALSESGYHFVDDASVYLIAPEVTVAYEKLQQATSAKEYNEIWAELPESVREQFTEQHLTVLDQRHEALNSVTYNETVTYNGTPLNVSVSGPIPETGVTLHVSAVSGETVLEEGFDIKDATDIITALDIKLLREDSTEWQPEDGERIYVSIDMAALGIEDETVVRLHHKHGEDDIYVFEVVVVLDGKVTVGVNGLSTFAVMNTNTTTSAEEYAPGDVIEMEVGEEKILCVRIRSGGTNQRPQYVTPNNPGNWVGTWQATDPSGAIFYEVFSQQEPNHNGGMWVAWIRVIALKETNNNDANPDNDLTITFRYNQVTYANNNPSRWEAEQTEVHAINITAPKSDDGRSLYLKDTINTDGCINAVLVDNNGNEIEGGLDGAAFNWSRYDAVNGNRVYIVPAAYENDYQSVNIARDHAGLVEARKEASTGVFAPVTYTLVATLADGTTETATYTVYYQSEFLNKDFEAPEVKTADYSFYPNGWANMFWKTTAPGTNGDLIRDIEYGHEKGGTANFGINARNEEQFAELNAQEFGALYQDIISVPHEEIDWNFSHAARSGYQNRMFIVIGPTEAAQKLTKATDLEKLGAAAKQVANALPTQQARNDFYDGKLSIDVTYEGAVYTVWYHDAADNTGTWADLVGTYEVPDNQYRTRLFFVTDAEGVTGGDDRKNYGNLIDTAVAGQYKTFMIEYYEQTYVDGHLQTERFDEYEETGEALIYSSQLLKNYNHFIAEEHDYLYKILINGKNYPYDIRYSDEAALYVEKYDGTATDPLGGGKSYEGYEIVMQVFLRDTVVAVQKELEFPTDDEGKQLLTEEQKLTIMEDLKKSGGYKATFSMDSVDEGYTYHQEDSAVVTDRDPAGNYKGFIALGENPELGHEYQIEETDTTDIVGLELDLVTFGVTRYTLGQAVENDELEIFSYTETQIGEGEPLVCDAFKLEGAIKIADVVVTNRYKEKMTTIYYKAVGKGKVQLATGGEYQDTPTETLAFYSGKATGAIPQAGNGATFMGWYTDPACEEEHRVTAKDGVYDEVTGLFKPNANIISADEVTFYAKFDTGAIVINRENANPGQIFVYRVQQTNGSGVPISGGADFYVTVAPDEKGEYREEIVDVPAGHYTVTEIGNWSWRHVPAQQTKSHPGAGEVVYTFDNGVNKPNWLNGFGDILKNTFKGGTS